MPAAWHGWAETVAAYRVLENPALGVQAIVSGHPHATLERLRAQEVVLLVPDTTVLDDGTTHPQRGMGTVQMKGRDAYLLPPTVAFPPERVTLGVVGMPRWPRPARPVAQQRTRNPIAEQERSRWLEGDHCACAVQQACPAPLGGNMAARAGDIQAWVVDGLRRAPGQRAECSMRAKENRRLAPGAAPRYVWAAMPQTGSVGTRTIDLARQLARPSRPVPLTGTATPVTCYGARRPGGTLPPVTVRAVYAQAASPPQGEAPVAWWLLTSLPVTEVPPAGTVVQW
jgi:hypothetical protein